MASDTCRVCGHPEHCHAGPTKQQDGHGGAVCVRCFNTSEEPGDQRRAWHAFAGQLAESEAAA